jgi:hypothetical protein
METQVNQQAADQVRSQDQTKFKPGQSGNPSGRTRTQLRSEQFADEFTRVHGRRPSAIEMANLRSCGALAAKIERGMSAQDVVRCSNSLWRMLRRLGLGQMPEQSQSAAQIERDIDAEILRNAMRRRGA